MIEIWLHIAPKALNSQCDYIGMSESFRYKRDAICEF